MALSLFGRGPSRPGAGPILQIDTLDVHFGRAHVLQGVSLSLDRGVLAVVGRNGMGKSTLCNAITGLVPAAGAIRFAGQDILGLPPNRITNLGIGYVPQGRRVWPSLTVDEHLRLAQRSGGRGPWTVARIYQLFPRLAERKKNGGGQLSGGEQQMLAIGRALLFEPRLLVMDEPTEGLAPVIVDQVVDMLKTLTGEGEISVLLIEQNLGVAIDVADTVGVMVNGRIARMMSAAELGANRELQHQLLGVRAGDEADEELAAAGRDRGRARAAHLHHPPCRRRCAGSWRARPGRCARGPRLHPLERRRSPGATGRSARRRSARRRSSGRGAARRADRRTRRQGGSAALLQGQLGRPCPRRPPRAGCSNSRCRRPSGGPPMSPGLSIPRAASCSTCATAWRSSACAP